ncbi:MAG: hypothetical protein GXX83_00570 [Gaiellales bacterium]|nr:hypothetical protein [Gaiellales bacterium]
MARGRDILPEDVLGTRAQRGRDLVVPAMERLLRRALLRHLAGTRELRLTSRTPSPDDIRRKFEAINSFGLYIHIPFCCRICPCCPYNKELYRRDSAAAYVSYLRAARRLGFLRDDGEQIVLSDGGAFWLHALEDLLSIDYVGKLWAASGRKPWPEDAVLS